MRTDARQEIRCEKCLTTMERREHERRHVCRNSACDHAEPFRDERGRVIAPPTPAKEPEPKAAPKAKRSTSRPRAGTKKTRRRS